MSKENAILAEMQKEIWVMEPRRLNALFTRLIELELKAPAGVEVVKQNKLTVLGDTAVIKISGILLKKIPSLYRWLGIEMTSYLDIQNQVREAVGNPAIKEILLDIDSPGGKVAGVMETGAAIANAAGQKQVIAQIEDLGASGAYWLASQATKIIAGPNAEVGAIGVFTVYMDLSAMAKNEGVKVHVIRSGEHKGMGVPGAEITDEQIAAVQKIIDGMADNFIKAVSSGRGLSIEAVRALADGRVFLAADAKKNGLIDSIITANKTTKVKEKSNMEQDQQIKDAAAAAAAAQAAEADIEAAKKQADKEGKERLEALGAAFPNDSQFVLEQFTAGATVEVAKAAFCDVLAERLQEAETKNAELRKQKNPGADPIPSTGEGGTQQGGFLEAARQRAKEDKCTMAEALKKTKKENPQLFEEYINSTRQ